MESDNNIIDLASERRRRGPRFDGGLMDILEVSRDLVCLCRAGSITAINGAGARLLGAKTTEELLGRSMAEFLIPEYGRVMELFLAGMASEDKAVPTRIVALDRTLKDVELQVYRAREISPDATVVMCRDISHEGKLAGYAQETDQRFHLLVDNTINLVCHVVDGVIRYANQAAIAMLGASAVEQVVGLALKDIFHGSYGDLFDADMVASIADEGGAVPLRLCRIDGSGLDAMVNITHLSSQHGVEWMIEARDITGHNRAVVALRQAAVTERRAMERELRRLATTDPLTGAASRRHFLTTAGAEMERALRDGHTLSVIMLDVDFFKRINDSHGHPAGDEALKLLVQTCLAGLRDIDLVGRLGGEEFAVLLPETALAGALEVAERLRERIAANRLDIPDGATIAFTCSLGVAERCGDQRIDALLARTDKALHRAKAEGRNRVLAG